MDGVHSQTNRTAPGRYLEGSMFESLLGATAILWVAAKRRPTLHRTSGFLDQHVAIARKHRALRRARAARSQRGRLAPAS
jgi:hypothetical protein